MIQHCESGQKEKGSSNAVAYKDKTKAKEKLASKKSSKNKKTNISKKGNKNTA